MRDAPVRATVSDAVTNVVTRPIASGGAWVVAYGGDVQYERRDDCDGRADPAYEGFVRDALRERYPSIAGAPRLGGWAGAYDATPDWNPAIGFLDDERYVVMGMSGHGLKLAPAIAECAAAQIAGREPPIDIAPLRPGAVRRGRPAAPRIRPRRPRLTGYSPAPMEMRRLGADGPEISVVGYGAWEAGGNHWGANTSEDDVVEAIHAGSGRRHDVGRHRRGLRRRRVRAAGRPGTPWP